jgi:hypothetical protein
MNRTKFLVLALPLFIVITITLKAEVKNTKKETINFTVTVLDKASSTPLPAVTVILKKNNNIISVGTTNRFGKTIFDDLEENTYELSTRYIGYSDYDENVVVDSAHRIIQVAISEKSVELSEIVVKENKVNQVSTSIDVNTGRKTFEGETYHAAPTSRMTQLIQQNLAGASRAPTGEVHIRGQHGEFSYLVDGIPIPLGVFGGLNEIVDPKVISKVTFLSGGFPAEYGGQITGLMDIQNRVPAGKLHVDISSFVGSYLTSSNDSLGSKVGSLKALNSNGQSISISDHSSKLSYFVAGSREETDRRIDQPVQTLSHDHGFDYFLYGKFDYLISQDDYITTNLNYSKTVSQIPFDLADGYANDNQKSYNAFQTISYFHTISSEIDHESNFFAGGFFREGGLEYTPDVNDDSKVYINNDTTTGYVLYQNRTFTTSGVRLKYDKSFSHQFKYAVGTNYSYVAGNEDFQFRNTSATVYNQSDYNGYDFGAFIQSEWHPYEWTKLDAGLRYDIHNAPSLANQYQLSPRAKLYFFIDAYNSISLSYDHLFMPTNIENLGSIANLTGNTASPTIPEKDNLYELSYVRNWGAGFNTKLSGFYKTANPGLDDETLGSSSLKVNVNIDKVKISGLEWSLTYNDLSTPFSGYINSSIIHAVGQGPVSGGFLPADSSSSYFDLDHDQRLSVVVGLNYQPENWFINTTATYGSGLTNGSDDYAFKTGLFDFNQGAHTSPSWILNLSAGYTFAVGKEQTVEPSLYITNLLDHAHLIKGAFFSGASFEERRNVVFKISYHI